MLQSLSGIRTVRALGLQAQSEAEFSRLATGLSKASFDAQRWEAAYEPAVGLTLVVATAITLDSGGWLVWQGELTIGQLTSFSLYLAQLLWPMFAAGWIFRFWSAARPLGGACSRYWMRLCGVDDHGTVTQVTPGPIRR